MKLSDCPHGPVLINGQLYIYCDMASPYDENPHAHLIRCEDWEYITFNNFANPGPGRIAARDLDATPVKLEVAA